MTQVPEHVFVVGGKVQAGRGIYIERRADQELLELCHSGGFGVVLHSRQVGKSSLIAHVSLQLRQSGIQTAVLDLTRLGTQGVTAEQWYLAFLDTICSQFAATRELEVADWWQEQAQLPIVYRLSNFLSGRLLELVKDRIVIFVDEIDTTLALDFTDDFFAAVREIYQRRDESPDVQRLSFVFAGSSTPDKLMKDASRTPFNIGTRIEITDFSAEECFQFARGFPIASDAAERILRRVHVWTQGHPYLTQKVCAYLAQQLEENDPSEEMVAAAVGQLFFGPAGEQDSNLNFVKEMLTERAQRIVGSEAAVLETYRAVLSGSRLPDDPQSSIHVHLKLSGVVVAQNGCLRIRNPIYRAVFGRRWLRERMPFNWRLIGKLSGALLVIGGIVAAGYFLFLVPRAEDEAAIDSARARFKDLSDEADAQHLYEVLCGRQPDEKLNRKLPPNRDYAETSYSQFWGRRADALERMAAEAGEQDADQRILRLALAGIKRDLKIPQGASEAFDERYENAVTVLRGHRGETSAVAFGGEGHTVVTGGADGVIKLWNTETTWELVPLSIREIPFQGPGTPLYKPNSLHLREVGERQLLTAASDAGRVMVWQFDSNTKSVPAVLHSHDTGASGDPIKVGALEPYTPRVALVDPSGAWLLISGGALEYVSIDGSKVVSRELPAGQDTVWSVAFLPTVGTAFATSGSSGTVPLWNNRLVASGSLRLGKSFRSVKVTSIDFSPDAKWFAAGTDAGNTVLGSVSAQTGTVELPHQDGTLAFARFCCAKPGPCWPEGLQETSLLTVTHGGNKAHVRLWKVALPLSSAPDKASSERTYPGSVFAVSNDCSLVATIGGSVKDARIEGVVLRAPWGPSPASDDPKRRLLELQQILRKRIEDSGEIRELTDFRSLKPAERRQTKDCTNFAD